LAHLRLDSGIDPLCHILDAHQDVQLLIDTLELFVVRLGVEARLHEILLQLVAELLDTICANVVVRHDQAVG